MDKKKRYFRATIEMWLIALLAFLFIEITFAYQNYDLDEFGDLEKKSLDETLILLGSDEAIENIARTKLGWSKIGETIIVFSDENASHNSSSAKEELSNIQKWYSYFFKINK